VKQKRVKRLSEEKSECEKVKALVESQGWKDVAQPLLDKMVIDTVGGIGKDGMWSPGIVGDANRKGYSTEYLLGYRMGLMDFNNRLKEKQKMVRKVDEQIKDLKSKTENNATTAGSWSYMPVKGLSNV
jgi:hypothetical protein